MRIRLRRCCARDARRFVGQPLQELPLRQPQRERARQTQRQPGLSSSPELNGRDTVESVAAMDQMLRPVPVTVHGPNCKATGVLVGGWMDVRRTKALRLAAAGSQA